MSQNIDNRSYVLKLALIALVVNVGHSVALPSYVHLHTDDEIRTSDFVMVNKPRLCTKHNSSNVLIAIKTSPKNIDQRNALRESWIPLVVNESIPYVFVMGMTTNETLLEELLNEDYEYGEKVV